MICIFFSARKAGIYVHSQTLSISNRLKANVLPTTSNERLTFLEIISSEGQTLKSEVDDFETATCPIFLCDIAYNQSLVILFSYNLSGLGASSL